MTATNAIPEVDVSSQSPAPLAVSPPVLPVTPPALLRGSAKGLEIVVDSRAPIGDVAATLIARLGEAPGFFRGSDVRVRVEHGTLAPGALARLDEIATQFELRIVEVGALTAPERKRAEDAVPRPNLAHGSAPSSVNDAFAAEEDTLTRAPLGLPALDLVLDTARAPTLDVRREAAIADDANAPAVIEIEAEPEPAIARAITQEMSPIAVARTVTQTPRIVALSADELPLEPTTTRVVVGPVRSGVILDHPGHLVVFGDVNPGAEVRAEGNIVVLGRLRGTAHAGIGNESGFILALRLEPQQLRICRQVARASDSDTPGTEAEIAYVTDASIVVERYAGRLPKNLAASI